MGALTLGLRAYAVAFLGWHLGLLFPNLAEPLFLALAGVVGLWGGRATRGLRAWLALPAGALAYGVVRTLVAGLPGWPGDQASVLDQLPLWLDRQLAFGALPFALGWVEGWAFEGRRAAERLVNALAAGALFWSQGPYHVTLYPHPLALALAYATFLVTELTLLVHRRPRASWAATLLVAAGLLGVLWSLLGRYQDQSVAAGGGLMKPDLFQFDFAPLVKLEPEITLGEDLVLLYREDGPAQPRYLRRLVLDQWDPARGFSASQPSPVVGRRARDLPPVGAQGRQAVRQEYYLVNIDPSSLLVLNEPTQVVPYARWDGSSFVNAYRVESLASTQDFWLFNEVTTNTPLPREADPEIQKLALEVTRGATTTYEKATALVLYFRENYFYSLKPGTPGPRGALKHFLFETKKGYCSYFAFSMTLMLRSLGVPARVAVGFATDPNAAVLGFNPVRAYQAHAWVEVPFGEFGWLEFDPTSDVPAPGEPFRFPQAGDPAELSRMISEILEAQPQPLDAEASEAPPTEGSPLGSWPVAALPWVIVGLLVGANEAWRHRWTLARWGAPEPRRAWLWWSQVVHRARRAGRGPEAGETPESWAARCPGEPRLVPLAAEVSRSRYAQGPFDLGAVEALARALVRHFDATRPPSHRLIAAIFPWWPR